MVCAMLSQMDNKLVSARMEDRRTAVSLGIHMHNGRMNVLVARNTALPAKVSKRFFHGGSVEILAGEHPIGKDNYRLGNLELNPDGISGNVRLSFDIDITSLLTVFIEDEQTGHTANQSFETFRDIHNVLASVESLGSWNVVTGLAEKSRASGQSELLTELHPVGSAAEAQGQTPMEQNAQGGHPSGVMLLVAVLGLIGFLGACRKYVELRPAGFVKSVSLMKLQGTDSAIAAQTKKHDEKQNTIEKLQMELRVSRLLLAQQREELEVCQQLTIDLPFIVYDGDSGHGSSSMRFVKIQCPGVSHRDIEIEIAVNGVVVKIVRGQSPGMSKLSWTKRFQFPPAEGSFEFKEEEVSLELGVLILPFKAYTPQPRVFRLPQHRHTGATYEAGLAQTSSQSIAEGAASWVFAGAHSSCATLSPQSGPQSSNASEEPFLTTSPQSGPQSSDATEESFLTLSPQRRPQSSDTALQRPALTGEVLPSSTDPIRDVPLCGSSVAGSEDASSLTESLPLLATMQDLGSLSVEVSSSAAVSQNLLPTGEVSSPRGDSHIASVAGPGDLDLLGLSPTSSGMYRSLLGDSLPAVHSEALAPVRQGSPSPEVAFTAISTCSSVAQSQSILPVVEGPTGYFSSLTTESSRSRGASSEGSCAEHP